MEPTARWLHQTIHPPYPVVLLTLSGAHLYGFPSPDSDYDLRGVHVLPLQDVIGLHGKRETVEMSAVYDGYTIDLVTHDIEKCCRQLLKRDGSILEHLYSPLVIQTSSVHEELQAIARECVTPQHHYHYLGLARSQWQLFEKEHAHRVKPRLYVYRALLTGIHLMRTGEVEANLVRLNETAKLPYIPELISRKSAGSEHAILADANLPFHHQEYSRLRSTLEEASQHSHLPAAPGPAARAALHDLLARVRLGQGNTTV
jgi:predicted nucleotidyltransferase